MTPTLLGRWQTRLLLLGTGGLIVTLIVGSIAGDVRTPLASLGYVVVLGLGWDCVYHYLQSWRWDRDWPPAFQVVAGVWEGGFVWGLIQISRSLVGDLPGVAPSLTALQFSAHYVVVWCIMFLGTQGLLRIIFPRWRYRGGQWW
jgi:hypothetical protein